MRNVKPPTFYFWERELKAVICHAHGCYNTSEPGKHYCTKHIALEERWGKRPTAARKASNKWHYLYSTARWKRISKDFLLKYPICFICGGRAEIADHITPHRGDLDLFYDENNLQPLCWRCHSAKTLKENNYFKAQRGL